MALFQQLTLLREKSLYQVLTLGLALYLLIFLGACSTQPKNDENQPQQKINIPFSPLSGWVERRFSGSSEYQLEQKNDHIVLTANSKNSASLLYKKIRIDLNQTPYLNWQWRIEQTYINNINEKVKKGDDFPARIYIAIKPRLGQIKPRALTYVWASHAEKFSHWKNPFANSVNVFALQSGEALVGKWVAEKRNLKQDLSKLFGQPIESIEGIGIMTDSDNSNTSGKASYSNLFFSRD